MNLRKSDIINLVAFQQDLLSAFREWEASTGRRQTVSAFARFLEHKQSTVSRWMNGDSVPDPISVPGLAEKLGDWVYDSLGMERPNPVLQRVQLATRSIPPENLEALSDDMEAFIRKWAADRGLEVKRVK